jgi:hypothetical protein
VDLQTLDDPSKKTTSDKFITTHASARAHTDTDTERDLIEGDLHYAMQIAILIEGIKSNTPNDEIGLHFKE